MSAAALAASIAAESKVAFRAASLKDIELLQRFQLPASLVEHYRKFEPAECAEIGEVRMWPAREIAAANSDYVPGADIHTRGYVVFATTICGDAYCFDHHSGSDHNDCPVVLIPHDLAYESMSDDDLQKCSKPVAVGFIDFLEQFQSRRLDSEPHYPHLVV